MLVVSPLILGYNATTLSKNIILGSSVNVYSFQLYQSQACKSLKCISCGAIMATLIFQYLLLFFPFWLASFIFLPFHPFPFYHVILQKYKVQTANHYNLWYTQLNGTTSHG